MKEHNDETTNQTTNDETLVRIRLLKATTVFGRH